MSYQAPSYCVSLNGSSTCPAFTGQYINPTNLSNAWPFFSSVTDLDSFDSAFQGYMNSTYGFRRTKYSQQLGCSAYDTTDYVLQYQQTFLCGEFSHISYSQACYTNGTGTPPVSRETCQVTCLQFAASEQAMLQNSTVCPSNTAGSLRDSTINKDFVQCTAWGTLATNDTATCILGEANEPNCGFGSSTAQLCSMCDPSQGDVPSCCLSRGTSLSACGFSVAVSPSSVTSPIGASSSSGTMALPSIPTGANPPTSGLSSLSSSLSTSAANATAAGVNGGSSSNSNGGSGLSGGAIAGIVIGSLVGAAVLLGLLAFCCILMRRKRRDRHSPGASDEGGDGGGMREANSRYGVIGRNNSSQTQQANTPSAHSTTPAGTPGSGYSGEKGSNGKKDGGYLAAGAAAGALGLAAAEHHKDAKKTTPPSSTTAPAAAAAGTDSDVATRPISGDTTGTGGSSTDNSRNLLSSYQDQYSSATIVPGAEVIAIYAYHPNLPDELRLDPDTPLTVVKLFDDGWAVGRLNSGQEGAFPLVCVTSADEASGTGGQTASMSESDDAVRSRGSSLRQTSAGGAGHSSGSDEEERLYTAGTGGDGMTSDAQSFTSARSRAGPTSGSENEGAGGNAGGYFSRPFGRR